MLQQVLDNRLLGLVCLEAARQVFFYMEISANATLMFATNVYSDMTYYLWSVLTVLVLCSL